MDLYKVMKVSHFTFLLIQILYYCIETQKYLIGTKNEKYLVDTSMNLNDSLDKRVNKTQMKNVQMVRYSK